jgi:hypothetical protein
MSQQYRHASRAQFWREAVAGWQESGQSVRAFCRRRHLQEASFYFWGRTLQERDEQRHTTRVCGDCLSSSQTPIESGEKGHVAPARVEICR